MSFSVTILGSSSALPTSKRFPTAQILNLDERFFLIDCGEGTQLQLRKNKFKFGRLNHIFISHVHGDHVFGLPGLISSFALMGRTNDLHIYGNPELGKFIDCFAMFYGDDLPYKIKFHPFGHRQSTLIYESNKLEVYTIPLKHRVPTAGFLFKEKPKLLNIRKEVIGPLNLSIKDIVKIKNGEDYIKEDGSTILNQELTLPPQKMRSYAFCSDTAYYEKIIPIIKGIDVLYHEATFNKADKKLAKETFHSTTEQAATIALKAEVKKLLLGHFSVRYKQNETMIDEAKAIFENTIGVNDGDTFEIE
ncbi:MAG: ribonuclease Z [Bacteroidales bacterium]|nr:ribonuclease Z [Bacteroidales bacterium]